MRRSRDVPYETLLRKRGQFVEGLGVSVSREVSESSGVCPEISVTNVTHNCSKDVSPDPRALSGCRRLQLVSPRPPQGGFGPCPVTVETLRLIVLVS